MPELQLILPGQPIGFADVETALQDPDGLLAIGGDLSTERLLAAYRQGIFPWFSEGEDILWWAPDPRAVLLPQEFACSRSLAKTLRKDRFQVSLNQNFNEVIQQCAALRESQGTWITSNMLTAYQNLHQLGHAHSVETWRNGRLVGGLYGVRVGSIFFGESMFSIEADASKVALAVLVRVCEASGIPLIDCQQASAHLARLGARLIKRRRFSEILAAHIATAPKLTDWNRTPRATSAWLNRSETV
jgi:leucyl/phenylalanyl-tRNA---protein transferase